MTLPECVEVIHVSPFDFLKKYSEQIGDGGANQHFDNLTPDTTVFVALSEGSPVGYALVKYKTSSAVRPASAGDATHEVENLKISAELDRLYVMEKQRKKRVSQKLVVKALQEIERKQCTQIIFTPGHDETKENGLRQVSFFNMIYNEIDRNPNLRNANILCVYDRAFIRKFLQDASQKD